MNVKTEDLGKNSYKIIVEVAAEDFGKAYQEAYLKNRNKVQISGFRKGKAPLPLIEKVYGPEVFYEDAADAVIKDTYFQAIEESGLEVVSRPDYSVSQIGKGQPMIYSAVVAVKPVVTLGEYKGIEVEKIEIKVEDSEVDAEIDKLREQNSRNITIDDQPVADKDIIKLDYEGSVDGVPFEGGTAKDAELVIGSHTFIDNFEEQLIGMNIGDEKEINVTFPEEYHSEELKGKPAVFKCKINSITRKELPEADDEFAQEVSEFDTLDELKNDIRGKLLETKKNEANGKKENEAILKIIENCGIDVPAAMIEDEAANMAEDFARRMQEQGMPFDQYLKYFNMTPQQFVENYKPNAEQRIKARLVLEEVVKAENIEVSPEEIDSELALLAERYGVEKSELKEKIVGKELDKFKMDLAVGKAAELVRDAAVEVEKKEEETKEEAEASKEEAAETKENE